MVADFFFKFLALQMLDKVIRTRWKVLPPEGARGM
jgi:hypothetical protein